MKKRRLLRFVPVILAAVLPGNDVGAQQGLVPYLGGGVAAGAGDLSSDTDNGWLVFGGLDLTLAVLPGLSVGATVSYTHIPYQGGFNEATNITGVFGEASYVPWATSAMSLKPYVRAGIGMLQHEYDPGTTRFDSQSESKIGFSAGAGLSYNFGSAAPFLGFHFVGTGETGFLAFHGGVAFPGVRAASRRRYAPR